MLYDRPVIRGGGLGALIDHVLGKVARVRVKWLSLLYANDMTWFVWLCPRVAQGLSLYFTP